MIRFLFHFTNYFIHFHFPLSGKLLFAGIMIDHIASFIWFLRDPSVLNFDSSLRLASAFQNLFAFRDPLVSIVLLRDLIFLWMMICLILMVELCWYFVSHYEIRSGVWRIMLKPVRVLPVHWYHLFVSIRYHKKKSFARHNIIQTNENVIV